MFVCSFVRRKVWKNCSKFTKHAFILGATKHWRRLWHFLKKTFMHQSLITGKGEGFWARSSVYTQMLKIDAINVWKVDTCFYLLSVFYKVNSICKFTAYFKNNHQINVFSNWKLNHLNVNVPVTIFFGDIYWHNFF